MDYSQYKQLEFRRKFWKIFGAEIRMTDVNGVHLLGVIKMKAWKLKEDIRLYRDEAGQQELMRIGARSVIDFGATYDVFDSTTNQQIFSLRRKGLKSTFIRDHWLIFDANGTQIGDVIETSGTLAILRRWLGDIGDLIFSFVSQTYDINYGTLAGQQLLVGKIVHRKNPFIVKMGLDTTMAQADVDPRLPVAIASLLSVIDANKNA
jgi:hypothetical protein